VAPLLIYGGTFDPVHSGHVAVAVTAADAIGAARVLLIPAGDPPHRAAPHAPGALRAELLRRAFAGDQRFVVDERELRRQRRSYTVDTLLDLRAELGPYQPLVLLLGADAFLGLPGWHRWREIPTLAHLAVLPRPGVALDPRAASWPDAVAAPVDDPARLAESPAGECLLLPGSVSSVSSTQVRDALARGETPEGLPAVVIDALVRAGNPYR